MQITQLDKTRHNREKFDCGVRALNEYLKKTARQHDRLDLSRTFVLTDQNSPQDILGFYSLSTCRIDWPELPENLRKKYPNTSMSAALIGRLAVDLKKQGQGYGGDLLIDAITNIVSSVAHLALPLIVVDAKDDKAQRYYEKFGFEPIAPSSRRLFMTVKHAKEMLDSVS
ncbi:GNAT family N-acetyltransferase [Neiella sp. HB171785]|uniref:GNAT family N-acetyltransferase n=1 Tax=Neiella litorisoli TaxID=2771431 RepID=A0A8J6QGA9_9GAMM|nr:GNAT family N-acetyltransferase [Neiella litorisoli]MBD1389379.1 GNAT family N-acetyltransferase [Neiella litorisoli]